MNGLDDLDSDILTSLRRRRRGVYGQPDVAAPPQDEGYMPSPEMLAASAGGAEVVDNASLPPIPRADGTPTIDPDLFMDLTGKQPELGMDLSRKGPYLDPSLYMDLTGGEPTLGMDLSKKPVIDPSLELDLTGKEPELAMNLGQPEMPSITFNDDVTVRPLPPRPTAISKRTAPGEYWDLKGPEPVLRKKGYEPSPEMMAASESSKRAVNEAQLPFIPSSAKRAPAFSTTSAPSKTSLDAKLEDVFNRRSGELLRKSMERRRARESAGDTDGMSALQAQLAGIKGPADALGGVDVGDEYNQYLRTQSPSTLSAPPLVQAEPGLSPKSERVAEAERQVTGAASSSPATSTDGDDRPDRDEYMRRAALQHLFNVTPALFGRRTQQVADPDAQYRADMAAWLNRKQQRESMAAQQERQRRLDELAMLTEGRRSDEARLNRERLAAKDTAEASRLREQSLRDEERERRRREETDREYELRKQASLRADAAARRAASPPRPTEKAQASKTVSTKTSPSPKMSSLEVFNQRHVKEIEERTQNINSALDKLAELTERFGTIELAGPESRQMESLMSEYATDMAKLKDPESVARPSEVENEMSVFAQPNTMRAMLTSNKSALAAIRHLKNRVNERRMTAYKVRGIKTPEQLEAEKSSVIESEQATPATQATSEDEAAIQWARENPNDPRAAEILKMHGG